MISRRECIRRALVVFGTFGFARGAMAQAAPKVPQKDAQYQDTPKNDQKCDICQYFIAGTQPNAPGTCQLVEGSISPNGWCALFAKKAG
ncbi:MAG TPA: high-potential iron-sulfur protein [Pseudolabrys sp.]|nr:high-potential iron-sulfur protein [Pseudolabrys sp.]